MSFNKFIRDSFSEYVTQGRQEVDLWIFQHVPKTAGTSLTKEISTATRSYHNIFVKKEDYKNNVDNHNAAMESCVDRFITGKHAKTVRVVSGHLSLSHISRIQETLNRNTAIFTLLRHPVDRVISEYRYCCTEEHPVYESFRKKYPGIEDFINDRNNSSNQAVKMLLGHDNHSDPKECIDEAFSTFRFIGIYEMYPLSFRVISTLLWSPSWPRLHLRKTIDIPENRQKITDSIRNMILEMNQLDYGLYEAVKMALKNKKDEILRYSGSGE